MTRPHSLAAKLASLAIGEELFFPDTISPGKATIAERSVTNLIAKSPALADRKFSTERWLAVRAAGVEARAILLVRRIQ